MQHFLIDTLPLFGFGFLGILIMAFIKMKDISDMNETYNFKMAVDKFMSREWPSYGLALVIIFTTALTHDEWLVWFERNGRLASLSEVPLGVKLSMVFWGCLGQYFIYKKIGKMKTPQATQKLDEKE
jgi:hypothetical protein